MEHMHGKSGQLWQDFRLNEYIPSDSAISLYPRRKETLLTERLNLQVILQEHGKIGVSPGIQILKWREVAFRCE